MTSLHEAAIFAKYEMKNLPKLIEDNAHFLYGIEYNYAFITTTGLESSGGPIGTKTARVLLIGYRKDLQDAGKGKVLGVGVKYNAIGLAPSTCDAMRSLHNALKIQAETRRRTLNLKEGDMVA